MIEYNNKIKAIIFDMDGVIIDSEKIWDEKEIDFLEGFDIDLSEQERLEMKGLNLKKTYEFLTQVSLDFKNKYSEENFLNDLEEFGLKYVYNQSNLVLDFREFIEDVFEKGIKLAIASSSPISWIETTLDRHDLGKYFQVYVSGSEVEKSKPEPDIYLEAAKRLGVDPSNCLGIEDSRNGILAVKNAGILSIGLRNGFNDNQKLDKADKIVNSFKEINGD